MIFRFKISFLIISSLILNQTQSGYEYQRHGIHNGNLVKTVFSNSGVVGQPDDKGPRGAWINDNNGYIGDVSLLVGVEAKAPNISGNLTTFHSVVVCDVNRPPDNWKEAAPNGDLWTFQPISGYMNESQQYVAMSTNPTSWPASWPDKDSDWDGKWNGYFGQDVRNSS